MKKHSTLFLTTVFATLSFAQLNNLVQNPGFETEELTPWSKGPTAGYTLPDISSDNPYNGLYNATYINSAKATGFYQLIEINPKTEYTLSFWYKSSGAGFGARLWSNFISIDNKNVDLITPTRNNPLKNNNRYLTKTDEWQQHIVKFTSPDNVSTFRLATRTYINSSVSFDDFSLIEGTLSTTTLNDFLEKVKMNTVVTDKLVIALPTKSTVNIYTTNGQLISSNRIEVGEIINTQSLEKGVYIVSVDNGISKTTQKIVKK